MCLCAVLQINKVVFRNNPKNDGNQNSDRNVPLAAFYLGLRRLLNFQSEISIQIILKIRVFH